MDGKKHPNDFICGVVEGFYGRPWTTDQRKDLFQKMAKWGMDSYLYAPKDDYKHRACWRDLYTVDETDHLSSLVLSAKENKIQFIYAISPGLDIIYSSAKDVTALKRKLEQVKILKNPPPNIQVKQLGCEVFAILFDDIDTEMCKADKEIFKSFAHAQVEVTNEIFQHLNVSKFLFCPTQYCGTRSVPNVRSSEYLKTLGNKLDMRIDIMWTGPKVISKDITIESIEEVTDVMRRPPVIWDNLHANDYDQKRLFLGPYAGRSPQLIPRLRGVLTNPNCEYGANFVAIHTLAQWSKCSVDAKKKIEESMSPDIKLETENEEIQIPGVLDPNSYHPSLALKCALKEWLDEFKRSKVVWGPIIKPQMVTVPVPLLPSVNTCIVTSTSTSTNTTITTPLSNAPSLVPSLPTVNCSVRELNSMVDNVDNGASIIPTGKTVMNSLISDRKVICASSVRTASFCEDEAKESLKPSYDPMPMDTATPPNEMADRQPSSEDILMDEPTEKNMSGTSTPLTLESNESSPVNPVPSAAMSLDVDPVEVESQGEAIDSDEARKDENQINVDDLQLLCELFFLPFEHGFAGIQILQEFQWLKANSHYVIGITSKEASKPDVIEWFDRCKAFQVLADKLNFLLTKLNLIPNRELLYEIYPYIWDMRGVVSLLNSYVKWLGFSKGWREAFSSGDQEPWVIRGGLTAELQRLIPVDRGTDLYTYKAPEQPSSCIYTIRPYTPNDRDGVFKVCLATFNDGMNSADNFELYPKLPGDYKLGGFLSLRSEMSLCFVVEDENEMIVGIAVGALNGKLYRTHMKNSWYPLLQSRYPMPKTPLNPQLKRILGKVHSAEERLDIPDDIRSTHPGEMQMSILNSIVDPSVHKRLMTCMLAAFRSNGVLGCVVEVAEADKYFNEFYSKLGFLELYPNFVGRNF